MHQTDLKKSWNAIKNIIGKVDHRRPIHYIDFLLNNQYIFDDGIIANTFNNYFLNVGSSLAKNIRTDINPLLYVQNIESSLHIPEITKFQQSYLLSPILHQDMMNYQYLS